MGRVMRLCVSYRDRLAHFQEKWVKKFAMALADLSFAPFGWHIPQLAGRADLVPCQAYIAQKVVFHLRKAAIRLPILNAAQNPALGCSGDAGQRNWGKKCGQDHDETFRVSIFVMLRPIASHHLICIAQSVKLEK